jgi:proteasome lid subunit RPN8/RPN11
VINELYNMRVVGWYHSHPSFPALPSVIDIANQLQVRCIVCGGGGEGDGQEGYSSAGLQVVLTALTAS